MKVFDPTDLIAATRVPTNGHIALGDYPTRMEATSSSAKSVTKSNAKAVAKLAHRLYGEADRKLLIVLQGMDTSGKDGTIKAILSRTPPLNTRVAAFKAPTKAELARDFLWRVHQVVPRAGEITVFNRSHYEDVLVVKVREFASAETVEQRYAQINAFEKLLVQSGTTVLKFMLHISPDVQAERLRDRLVEPDKRWKFNPGDLEDRALWPAFMDAYETMLQRTSTDHAPWHVIPSDSRKARGAIISSVVRHTLEQMDPQYPDPGYRPEDFDLKSFKVGETIENL